MAIVKPTSGKLVYPNHYPSQYVKGSALTPESEQGVSILRMPHTAICVYNSAVTDVILSMVPAGNDIADVLTVTVKQGEVATVSAFNAIAVGGSTGHDLATTHYGIAWRGNV